MHGPSPDARNDPALAQARHMVLALQYRLQARLIETHISWVLLDGVHAWKIKKPVHLPFLDAREVATRRMLCEAECALNRRLAPSLYLRVAAITGSFHEPELDGAGAVLDHALCMRQFPDEGLWSNRVAQGLLTLPEVDRLAHRLASFHQAAPSAPPDSPWGTPARRLATWQGTLDGLAAQPEMARRDSLATVTAWLSAEAERLPPFWQARHDTGHIREGHGDLHLANLLTLPDGEVTAFDCIEFDPALRWIDPISDIAFAVMDLAAHGRADAAWRLLNGWLDHTGDHAGVPGLRAELVHRAAVRALVGGLSAPPLASSTHGPDYLDAARRFTLGTPPSLTITHGLSGSGKSHASQRLLQASGAIRLRADVERKRLFGLSAQARSADHIPGGIYSADASQRTYAALLHHAERLLQAGWPVVLDAAFLRRAERTAARALAQRLKLPFGILHCEAPTEVLQARLAQRAAEGLDPSEADASVLARQGQWIEPLDDDERACVTPMPA